MWKITKRGPDRLCFLRRDGWMEKFSWILILALGVALLALLGWTRSWAFATLGSGFTLLGLWGILRRRTFPTASFDHIALEPQVRRGSVRAPLWLHPVALRGPGELRVAMEVLDDAEAFAAALAELLKLPVRRVNSDAARQS